MGNIGLIISREYLSRVQKKSFIIMTLIAPLLFGGVLFFSIWTATRAGGENVIQVLDESQLFEGVFDSNGNTSYRYSDEGLDKAKEQLQQGEFDGILYIPKIDIEEPKGIVFYAPSNPSINLVNSLKWKMRQEVEAVKLKQSGLNQEILDGLKSNLEIGTISLSETGDEKESSSGAATAAGYASGFLIYMFIFIYGAMCMRGVVEEKTSRIIEVVISSVRPFHLMLGKVIGIAGVGLTQFLLWMLLTFGVISVAGVVMGADDIAAQKSPVEQLDLPQEVPVQQQAPDNVIENIKTAMDSVNIGLILVSFVFFFFSGYLFYGALFAAIGSAVDNDADTQQFMFPIIMPLILAIIALNVVINDPNGSVAFWMSMIPFTSPIVMMMRIPFGVPAWELILSMTLMIGGFLFTIWIASRIYRIGILMHGTKVNYKTLAKWIVMKN
ncbi:MAG: ABC transporter permease [Cyclobacteriaceae bacterium]